MRKTFVISGVVTLAIGGTMSYSPLVGIMALFVGVPIIILGSCITLAGFWRKLKTKHVAVIAPSAMLAYEIMIWITITVIVDPYF